MLKIAWHPIYKHPLPAGHRFPMAKYELLPEQLLREGTCTPDNFFEPEMPEDEVILNVHTTAYLEALKGQKLDRSAIRKLGFPLSEALVEREYRITQGTITGCDFALEYGVAMNIAGGTHHAYTDHGEAFCLLNDQAIGAKYLLQKKLAGKVLIVDLDVHQGNGTAEIFQNEAAVYTFSMHGAKNYPFKKEVSDLDIALEDGTDDHTYLSILKKTLPELIRTVQPDFIFYLSGVDIVETDKLGRLGCSVDGCRERDRFVLQCCKDKNIPVQISMGGGYSRDIDVIVEAHANTFRMVQSIYF